MSDLSKLYHDRLGQLGIVSNSRIHSTRLKNKLLTHFPDLSPQSHGKEVLLVFDEHIAGALSSACRFDSDMEASILVKAAHIIRQDMLNKTNKFSGSFSTNCQEESVPQSLSALMQMILEGPSIVNQ